MLEVTRAMEQEIRWLDVAVSAPQDQWSADKTGKSASEDVLTDERIPARVTMPPKPPRRARSP